MSDLDLDAVEARADAATDGPWFWRNAQGRSGAIYLQGARTRIVMAFKRMGMNGAQPMFPGLDGLLYESADVNINQFPDAEFIAHARTDVPALVALVRAKESWIDGAKVDMAALEEAAAKATAWHMEALDDLAACVAERDEARAEVERLRLDADKRLSWAIFAVRDYDAYAQPFVLMRDTDVSGVSGTGVVADGVAFPDGTVALRWRGGNPTSVVFHDNGVESVEAIHGHGGATRLVWLAEDLETTAEVAATYDERDDLRRRYEALRDGVTGLCYDPDPDTDDGMTLISVDAIRAVVARVEGDES